MSRGDSGGRRDRIESAPSLRRVHAQSAQQRLGRIWWLESEDLSQHLRAVTCVLRRMGLTASSSTFFAAGVMRRRSFVMTALIVGLFGTARIARGSVGARPHAQGAQGFPIERLEGLATLLKAGRQLRPGLGWYLRRHLCRPGPGRVGAAALNEVARQTLGGHVAEALVEVPEAGDVEHRERLGPVVLAPEQVVAQLGERRALTLRMVIDPWHQVIDRLDHTHLRTVTPRTPPQRRCDAVRRSLSSGVSVGSRTRCAMPAT